MPLDILSLSLVWPCNVLGPLQLNFESLHPNLETIHRLNKIRFSKTGETIIIMMRRVINIILITWMIKDHCHDHHNFKLLPKIGEDDDDDDHLDCSLSAALVVEADEAKAFALVCSSVNEHLMIVKIIIMMIIVVMSLTKTLELMTFPNGKNICISSASPNSCEH